MMTRDEAVAFGEASAAMALDQADAYGGLKNSIDSHRENVRDTLNDEHSNEYESEAWAAFDAFIAAQTKRVRHSSKPFTSTHDCHEQQNTIN